MGTLIRLLLVMWLLILLPLYLFGCGGTVGEYGDLAPAATPSAVPTSVPSAVQARLSILDAMAICGNRLSDARRTVLAMQIERIANQFLHKPEHIQAFVGLLCIESKFDSNAKSSAGALGIAQIMPRYASYFAEECGLGKADPSDLADTEINLTIGACHFGKLLDALDGNIALALSGYNSGQDSETTKRLAKLAEGHPETMAYIAKFYSYINKLQLAQAVVGGRK